MTQAEIIKILTAKFPQAVIENETIEKHQVEIKPDQWLEVATFLHDDPKLSFDQLECITGVDTGIGQALQSRYNLHSFQFRHKLEVVINLDRNNPKLPSIEKLWRIGDWFERETYDMYGIVFEGHPDLRRILCPEDWEGWPLRKDYETPQTYHGIVVPKVKEEWE